MTESTIELNTSNIQISREQHRYYQSQALKCCIIRIRRQALIINLLRKSEGPAPSFRSYRCRRVIMYNLNLREGWPPPKLHIIQHMKHITNLFIYLSIYLFIYLFIYLLYNYTSIYSNYGNDHHFMSIC